MPGPLLSTKLFIPPPGEGTVDRPRLAELFDRGSRRKLTLVSAQAGFGKTTAIASWLLHQRPRRDPVAWVSLDAAEAEPDAFWTYVVTAVARCVPAVAESTLPLLDTPHPPMTAVLTDLVNQLAEMAQDLVVVLDDYHLVDVPAVSEGMVFVLDNLPPRVHLVLSTRVDPDLPLSRLRAGGQVVEVRASDLRFTAPETASYLGLAGLDLDPADVVVLGDRTEGWAAALQLAALSLRDRDDPGEFIADFAGDDRYVVDYLVDEVLTRQPRRVRDFLVATCVLDRLTGSLCDAVTGQEEGARTLRELERQNLFLVPLDARRHWYRYHHLFADVLRAHLAADLDAPSIRALHHRASAWYEREGQPTSAVHHALAAGDTARAAALLEVSIPDLLRRRQEAVVAGWVDALPTTVVAERPVLAMGLVAALMSRGDFATVPQRLDELERLLADLAGTGADPDLPLRVVVEDPEELPLLAGRVQLYRAALALVAGDLEATHHHVRLVADLAGPDDHPTRAGAWGLSGLAHWNVGDLEATHECYSRCVEELMRVGHVPDVLGCTTTLADLRVTQGRFRDARTTLERALALAGDDDGPVRGTADMHTGLAELLLELGDVEGCEAELRRAQALGEGAGMPQHPYRVRVAMALARQARGDVDEALALLEEAERVYVSDFMPNVRPVHATRARVLVEAGRLGDARDWAARHDRSPADEPSYLHEYEDVTLAMLLLAEKRSGTTSSASDDLTALLSRLRSSAEDGDRLGTLVEVLVLQSLDAHLDGRPDDAASELARALDLAEPEGRVRVFTRHGAALAPVLRLVPPARQRAGYVRRLAAACSSTATPDLGSSPTTTPSAMVDPLSRRELEVLRLLDTDLTGPELARHLVVSLNTLRTHTRNVYAKLGVSGRRAAVSRARELHLLARPSG
jgi:LuxR family maltose regulon positive regulatory protein